jgi:hypothetical protein
MSSTRAIYTLRPGSYNETQGPTDGPREDKTLCNMALMDMSSK